MAPHSSTLAWKIPWMEEPGGLQPMWRQRVGHDWATSLSHIGEGNGNPLQCSCLENPKDGGAWWTAVYGVAQSRTPLKRLSSSSKYLSNRNPISKVKEKWRGRIKKKKYWPRIQQDSVFDFRLKQLSPKYIRKKTIPKHERVKLKPFRRKLHREICYRCSVAQSCSALC